MTGASLVVLDPGLHVTLQDGGRRLARRWGVPQAGALDEEALLLGNALVANEAEEAALELLHGGVALVVRDGAVRVALSGAGATLEVEGPQRTRWVDAWVAVDAGPGEVLRVRRQGRGRASACAYLVVAGGFDVTPTLGSRSTLPGVGLGGWRGRALVAGDVLPLRAVGPIGTPRLRLPWPPVVERSPLHVVPGPQLDRLAPAALELLTSAAYRVSAEADRMGLRLDGPALPWRPGRTDEMPSDGVVPGSIQVPPDGRPILLLADCQTTGGYPKVGVVCRADLARAGRLSPGDEVRFAAVSVGAAQQRRRAQRASLLRRAASARPVTFCEPNLRALHEANLVGDAFPAADADPIR